MVPPPVSVHFLMFWRTAPLVPQHRERVRCPHASERHLNLDCSPYVRLYELLDCHSHPLSIPQRLGNQLEGTDTNLQHLEEDSASLVAADNTALFNKSVTVVQQSALSSPFQPSSLSCSDQAHLFVSASLATGRSHWLAPGRSESRLHGDMQEGHRSSTPMGQWIQQWNNREAPLPLSELRTLTRDLWV